MLCVIDIVYDDSLGYLASMSASFYKDTHKIHSYKKSVSEFKKNSHV